uniref:Solute carrier family 43 member 3-like n=1 Tax=Echeneis naucrates TaxID=173247 RepID=A0A665W2Y8_ECHNA
MFNCVGTRLLYWLTLASGMLECLCFAGVVFGYASLVFVLKEDRYFGQLCDTVPDCSRQDEKFSLVFTIASFLNNFMTLVNVHGSKNKTPTLLFPALSFISVGGILLLLTNMQVGNLFPAHRSTVITFYNGAFDSSAAVFLIIKVLHEQGIGLRSSFLVLTFSSIIHLLRTFLLMPRKHIPYPPPPSFTYGVNCGRGNTYSIQKFEEGGMTTDSQNPSGREFTSAPAPELKAEVASFRSCVLSWFFLWHLLWLSIMQLRHYLFIGTLNATLNRLADNDPDLVSQYTNAFAFTQLCGVLCAPWNGLIMDRHKGKPLAPGEAEHEADLRSSSLSLFLTSLQCLLFSVCASSRLLPLQYLTFILQVLNRSFLYGGNAAFISIAFPACHFGKMYGLVMSISAVVSLLQYPCFSLIKGALGGDPFFVDIALTLLTLLVFVHPFYVYIHCRKLTLHRQKYSHTEADNGSEQAESTL